MPVAWSNITPTALFATYTSQTNTHKVYNTLYCNLFDLCTLENSSYILLALP